MPWNGQGAGLAWLRAQLDTTAMSGAEPKIFRQEFPPPACFFFQFSHAEKNKYGVFIRHKTFIIYSRNVYMARFSGVCTYV